MSDGKVIEAYDGSSCYGPDARNLFKSNRISIEMAPFKEEKDSSMVRKFVIENVHIQEYSIPDCFKKIGAIVKKGDLIARSGCAGFTPTPHLHLQVIVKFDRRDSRKGIKVKGEVQEIIMLAESLGVDQLNVTHADSSTKLTNAGENVTILEERVIQLRKLLKEKTLDEHNDYLRHWIENKIFRRKTIDIELLKLIPEYLNISEWSIPFKIQGQQ